MRNYRSFTAENSLIPVNKRVKATEIWPEPNFPEPDGRSRE